MTNEVHIVGVGARTPLGLNAEASMAAVRAGIARIEEHAFFLDRQGEPVRLALDAELNSRLTGPERFTEMAATALEEVCSTLAKKAPDVGNIPLFLGLPPERPGWARNDMQLVRDQLAQRTFPVQLHPIELFPCGHAAGLLALDAACQMIHAGQRSVCVIAGVDSYWNFDTLEWLHQNRQLATPYHRGAFFPGEGVGAVAVAAESVARRHQWKTLGRMRGIGVAIESNTIKTDTVCMGEGLTACIRKAVSGLRFPGEAIDGIICDINGERYRAEEWGFALLRLPEVFVDPTGYDLPTSCWGDMGAASGPLAMVTAVKASQKGWAKGARYLIWNSSEGGQRAAVTLELNA